MSGVQKNQDVFGIVYDEFYRGNTCAAAIVERDDGLIEPVPNTKAYFADFRDWPAHQRKAIRYAQGRVLDIGCGGGRCLLYLQNKGLEAVGIDNSPLAVKVCRKRGAKKVFCRSFTQINSELGKFDTLVMFGNNFGLVGNPRRAVWWLKKMYHLTSARGRIIAECADPYRTKMAEHLEYHRQNRNRGRLGGQARIRMRYKKYRSPWFELLLVSEMELRKILKPTGWQIVKLIDPGGFLYVAVLEKS